MEKAFDPVSALVGDRQSNTTHGRVSGVENLGGRLCHETRGPVLQRDMLAKGAINEPDGSRSHAQSFGGLVARLDEPLVIR